MNPVLSIGIYLIMQTTVLLLSRWGLSRTRFRTREGWAFKPVLQGGMVLYAVLSLLPVLGAMLPDSPVKFFLQGAGNIWLGFSVYFNGILIILSLAAGLLYPLRKNREGRFFGAVPAWILLVSFLGGTILLAYGMIHAQHTVVTEYDITIDKDAGDVKDLTLVLIADLHLSVNSHLSTTKNMVETVNGLDADAVVIAGDIFTSSYGGLRHPEEYAEVLSGMTSKYGTYAVYGNHDVEETLFGGFPISPISQAFRTKEMEQFFKDAGFTVLYDETAQLCGGAVQLVGRVDGEKAGDGTALRQSAKEVLSGTDPAKPVIVLQHEPVEFSDLKENGADLVLCGHTHAGQIFPGNLIVPFFNENAYGYKNVSGVDTVVTAGVGYYGPPMRVGTNSEITVVRVHFGEGA